MTSDQKSIDAVFQTATEGGLPHAWQRKLAVDAEPKNRLIRIPTGMGKTLGVLATWLHHRVIAQDTTWPTRLVWCLPMRTLVEQTRGEAERLIQGLGLTDQVDAHVLMGGVEEHRWYGEPERPKILVGTQDMLLSRALKPRLRNVPRRLAARVRIAR